MDRFCDGPPANICRNGAMRDSRKFFRRGESVDSNSIRIKGPDDFGRNSKKFGNGKIGFAPRC